MRIVVPPVATACTLRTACPQRGRRGIITTSCPPQLQLDYDGGTGPTVPVRMPVPPGIRPHTHHGAAKPHHVTYVLAPFGSRCHGKACARSQDFIRPGLHPSPLPAHAIIRSLLERLLGTRSQSEWFDQVRYTRLDALPHAPTHSDLPTLSETSHAEAPRASRIVMPRYSPLTGHPPVFEDPKPQAAPLGITRFQRIADTEDPRWRSALTPSHPEGRF